MERRRRWIKLYPLECLDGSIRYQLESDERGVWYDLINFSALCSIAGTISDRDSRPYPHSFIANRLNISLELLERTLKKCIKEGRIIEDVVGLRIANWKYYQSEYDRVKGYQQAYRGRRRGIVPESMEERLTEGWRDDGFGNWYKPVKQSEGECRPSPPFSSKEIINRPKVGKGDGEVDEEAYEQMSQGDSKFQKRSDALVRKAISYIDRGDGG